MTLFGLVLRENEQLQNDVTCYSFPHFNCMSLLIFCLYATLDLKIVFSLNWPFWIMVDHFIWISIAWERVISKMIKFIKYSWRYQGSNRVPLADIMGYTPLGQMTHRYYYTMYILIFLYITNYDLLHTGDHLSWFMINH